MQYKKNLLGLGEVDTPSVAAITPCNSEAISTTEIVTTKVLEKGVKTATFSPSFDIALTKESVLAAYPLWCKRSCPIRSIYRVKPLFIDKPLVIDTPISIPKPVTGVIEVSFTGFSFSPELFSPQHPKLYTLQQLSHVALKGLIKQFNDWCASEGRGPMSKGEIFLGLLRHLLECVEAAPCGKIQIKIRHFLDGFKLSQREIDYIERMLAQCELFCP
jgi:hypothetical protein